MELLAKAGYNGITRTNYIHGEYNESEILNRTGTKIKDLIHLPKNVLKTDIIKNLNEGIILKLEQIHEKGNGLSVDFLNYLNDNNFLYRRLLNNVLNIIELGFSNKEIHSYFIKTNLYQAIDGFTTLELWYDYINMAMVMEVPYEKFPNSLKKEHDLMTRNYEYHKKELIEKQFGKRGEELSKLEYKGEKYLVKTPKTTADIIREGKRLRHCVACYIERIAKGETVVLFIRKKENPEEPFYTFEIQNKQIVQIRGFANKDPEQEIINFVNEWKKEKLGKKIKISD